MKKIGLLIISMTFMSTAMGSNTPGQALLDNFSATCTTSRNWTDAALSDARSLMNTLEQIKNDPDCQSISGAISQLGNLESKLSTLNSDYEYQIEIAKLEGQEIEILSQIANQTDSVIISELESSLRSLQLDKAGLIAMDGSYTDYNSGELKNLYAQILASSSSAYGAISSNQLCLGKHGGILASAASLSGSIAASAGSINPAFGYGLATVSDFIGNTVNFFRDRGYNSSIRRVANGSTVMQGFKCAMESLTNRWCDIGEAEEFLNFEASFDPNSSENDDLSIISNIYDKDIPVFLNWLEKVKSGAPASNSADAGRRERIYYREASLRSFKSKGEGWFAENTKIYDLAQGREAKYSVLRTIINQLRDNLENRGPNPLMDIHTATYAPYYLLGLTESPKDSSGSVILFDNFNPFKDLPAGSYTPDLQLMITLYDAWITQAQRRVTQELNQVLQPDPLQILSIYGERTSNIWKQSPANALKNILKFIKDNKPKIKAEDTFSELYETTIEKLVKINNAVIGDFSFDISGCGETGENPEEPEVPTTVETQTIDDVLRNIETNTPKTCDKLKKALEIIFEEAQLEFGPIVFKNRLETIIRIAIDEYIKNVDSTDRGHIAQLLAADSFLDVLSLVSGTDDRGLIREDIKSAKRVALNNMINFGDTFGFYINSLFKSEQSLIMSTDEDISGPVHEFRARMCFLLASLPKWPSRVKKSYCIGYKLNRLSPGGPESQVLTNEFLNSNFGNRSCAYRDFLEKTKIYQDWGILLGPKNKKSN